METEMAQKIDIAEVCPCTVQHNKLVWVLRLKMPFEKIEFYLIMRTLKTIVVILVSIGLVHMDV